MPQIVPAICPDVPGRGAPSDHKGVIFSPHTNTSHPPKSQKIRKEIRPIPESLLIEFGDKLSNTDFSLVYKQPTSTKIFLISETFPLKTITISSDDKPWFNEELRE